MYTMVIPSRQRLSNNTCKKKKIQIIFYGVLFLPVGKRSETKTFEAEKPPFPFFHFFFFFFFGGGGGGVDPRELLIFMIKVSSDICSALIPFTT